jgi:hypothetical protein
LAVPYPRLGVRRLVRADLVMYRQPRWSGGAAVVRVAVGVCLSRPDLGKRAKICGALVGLSWACEVVVTRVMHAGVAAPDDGSHGLLSSEHHGSGGGCVI